MEENKPKLEIELNPETAKGHYSNFSVISHTPDEFVIDFISMLPGLRKALVNSRVILSPVNAKRLLEALKENIADYEGKFGSIRTNQPTSYDIPMGFNNSNKKS